MDRKYRDKAKAKKPRGRTMRPDLPSSIVRNWMYKNKGRVFTRKEISEELPTLEWEQIYAVILRMRRRWRLFLHELHKVKRPDDPEEEYYALAEQFHNTIGEVPIGYDPHTKTYSVLPYETKALRDFQIARMGSDIQDKRVTEMEYLHEPYVEGNPQIGEHTRLALSGMGGAPLKDLMHHECGSLVGPSMEYCPKCGKSLRSDT